MPKAANGSIIKSIIGKRFGRLLVIEQVQGDRSLALCQCDCGKQKIIRAYSVYSGNNRSCGCLHTEANKVRKITHGDGGAKNRAPEYRSWAMMIQRCTNPNVPNFAYYGGRGITVCQRWLDSYEAFLADMGRKPSKAHSIDRYPDKNGNYEPDNCRWATKKEQTDNRNERKQPPLRGPHGRFVK